MCKHTNYRKWVLNTALTISGWWFTPLQTTKKLQNLLTLVDKKYNQQKNVVKITKGIN